VQIDKNVQDELENLIRLEKQLEKRIEEKKKQTIPMKVVRNENSIEKEAEKLLWPNKPQANWSFLRDESSTISNLANRHQTPKTVTKDPSCSSISSSSFLNTPSSLAGVDELTLKDIDDPEFPVMIAQKVMKRLQQIQITRLFQNRDSSIVYNDAAMNTSNVQTPRATSTSRPQSSPPAVEQTSIDSGDTSFRSLPRELVDTTRLKEAVQAMKDRLKTV